MPPTHNLFFYPVKTENLDREKFKAHNLKKNTISASTTHMSFWKQAPDIAGEIKAPIEPHLKWFHFSIMNLD